MNTGFEVLSQVGTPLMFSRCLIGRSYRIPVAHWLQRRTSVISMNGSMTNHHFVLESKGTLLYRNWSLGIRPSG